MTPEDYIQQAFGRCAKATLCLLQGNGRSGAWGVTVQVDEAAPVRMECAW